MGPRRAAAKLGSFLLVISALSVFAQLGGCEVKLLAPLHALDFVTQWALRAVVITIGLGLYIQFRGANRPIGLDEVARQSSVVALLRYVHQVMGASLAAGAGPRIVQVCFFGRWGVGRSSERALGAVALIDAPQGRVLATHTFASNEMALTSCDPSVWQMYLDAK